MCSAVTEDITSLKAKFIICSFDPNGNGVKLNRDTIEQWMNSLVSQPVVGKIAISDTGEADFTSHNLVEKVKVDVQGNPYVAYEFDSSACGVFTSVEIEKIDGKEYITATAKLWKRFPEFCSLVKKRLLHGELMTSWEIAPIKFHYEAIKGKKVKVIDEGRFLGHSLLAQHIPPAYPESMLLEVAQRSDVQDDDLINALSKDLVSLSENENLKHEKEEQVMANEMVENTAVIVVNAETKIETSAMTETDLRQSLRKAIAGKLGKNVREWDFCVLYHFPADKVVWIQMWGADSELDVITFSYEVEGDVVTVSDPVNAKLAVSVAQINETVEQYQTKESELSESLVKANETIQSLSAEISTLNTFKEKFETSERERIEAEQEEKRKELKSYTLRSNLIMESEISENAEIKGFIEQLDKNKINAIIAERFMQKQMCESDDSSVIEAALAPKAVVAENKVNVIKASLDTDDGGVPDHKRFIKQFLENN